MDAYPYYQSGSSGYYSREQQQTAESILSALANEAEAADFYYRLAQTAPNQQHHVALLQAAQTNHHYFQHFYQLYLNLTGQQPVYQTKPIQLRDYETGMKQAYQLEKNAIKHFKRSSVQTSYSQARQLFLSAAATKKEVAARFSSLNGGNSPTWKDYGGEPFVVNIEEATTNNTNFRTALWTGEHLQMTLMSIDVGDDIGLEVHPETDQFIRIEQGQGLVQMGDSKDQLDFTTNAYADYAILIPAGKWHNLTNTGNVPLKLYAIYAPPEHPFGTIHKTKADAMEDESY